jgi:hypothetical protein
MGFLNLAMLIGLAGVTIPIIIHLLNRRRFDVVDWGAMQFLQISETTRRRLLIEELILLLLRMGLIAIIVLALAGPFLENSIFGKLGRGNRDIVLIFDGSYSMGFRGSGQSTHETAREWANRWLDGLEAGDTVAILQAKQQVVSVLEPSSDLERVRDAIAHLPPPAGGCDWPAAVQAAHKLLAKSQRAQREIVVLGDGQRVGWADDANMLRWELLAFQFQEDPANRTAIKPRIRVVNLDPRRPAEPANWSLAPLSSTRAVAAVGQQVTFRAALELRGQKEYKPPHRLWMEVDGQKIADLPPPLAAPLDKGQVPLTFTQRFSAPGSHIVSLIVEPDPPPESRPPGYVIKDHLPGDNRQDFAIEVVSALPVLLVDGDTRPNLKRRGIDFLRDALAPARDRTPVVTARVVPVSEFDPAMLATPLAKEADSKPRVVVLANVPRVSREQQEALAGFVSDGGGLLVTLGDRADLQHYNDELHRAGQGWLPAHLDDLAGDENRPQDAVSPLPSSFFHPALDLFREVQTGGLGDARFPRWWRVSTPGRNSASVPVALMTSNDPFVVERAFHGGRVLLATVPLDNSWRTNLPDLPAFAPLAHELVYYLAGARAADHNVKPGQPLRYAQPFGESLDQLTLQLPDGPARPLAFDAETDSQVHKATLQRQAKGPVVVFEGTRETGVYRFKNNEGRTTYYVVQPDHQESDLTPSSDSDRERVAKLVPMTYQNDPDEANTDVGTQHERQEFWWAFLLGVIALLCGEVYMTRRIVRGR